MDKGTEFIHMTFKRMLTDNNIYWYSSENDIKPSIIKRFNCTLKTKMSRYFTFKNTWHYIDVLQKLVLVYNVTCH